MEKLLLRIWYTLLVIVLLLLTDPAFASAPTRDKTCHHVAEHAETIHRAYVKGIDMGAVLIVYQGSDDWSRHMRDLVTKVYRSDTRDLDSKEMYRFTYDICMNK